MSRPRIVNPSMMAPTHSSASKPCITMTETAIHTIALPEGHFTAIVHSNPGPDSRVGVIAILDHDEVEEHIRLLLNSVEDAKRLDAGLPDYDLLTSCSALAMAAVMPAQPVVLIGQLPGSIWQRHQRVERGTDGRLYRVTQHVAPGGYCGMPEASRWGEADTDPLADLARWKREIRRC